MEIEILGCDGCFNTCIDNCGIVELKDVGGSMSWFNGHAGHTRKWAKLDRALVNLLFLTFSGLQASSIWLEQPWITSRC